MPEIPIDLTPRKRDDGKLDLIGKDDAGGEYVARTCETGSFTTQDAEGLAFADRERVTPSDLVKNVVAVQDKEKADRESAYEDELMAASGPVVHGALHSFWGTGYGRGTALKRDGGFHKGRWVFDKDGRISPVFDT